MNTAKVNLYSGIRNLVSDFFYKEEFDLQAENEEFEKLFRTNEFQFFTKNINGFFMFYNYRSGIYEYVSDTIYSQLGFSPDLFLGIEGTHKLYSLIEENHAHIFLTQIVNNIMKCLAENVTAETGKDFRYSCSMKIKNTENIYRWFLVDTIVLQTEENGLPYRTFISLVDIHQYKTDELLNYSVLKKDERGIYQVLMEKSLQNSVEEHLLTDRETTILSYIANGLQNKQIADKLNISIDTVKAHRRNIITKTKCKGTAELTTYAYCRGLL